VRDLDGGPAGLEDRDTEHVDKHGGDAPRALHEAPEYRGEGEGDHDRAEHVPRLLLSVPVHQYAEDRRHQGVDHLACESQSDHCLPLSLLSGRMAQCEGSRFIIESSLKITILQGFRIHHFFIGLAFLSRLLVRSTLSKTYRIVFRVFRHSPS
jgi:hypothetical protein